jgi:hypothetical protein
MANIKHLTKQALLSGDGKRSTQHSMMQSKSIVLILWVRNMPAHRLPIDAVELSKQTKRRGDEMSYNPTNNAVEGNARPIALIGPVNGMFMLFEACIERRRFKADADDIYRLLDSISDQINDKQEASE